MMKKILLISLTYVLASCSSTGNKRTTKLELIPWGSEEGQVRLSRSKYKTDFFQLANHFEGQVNKIYCGVASSAIVLNALKLKNQKDVPLANSSIEKKEKKYMSKKAKPFFQKFTQHNVLNGKAKKKIEILGKPMKIKNEMKKDFGIQLDQLAKIIESNGAKAVKRVVSDQAASLDIKNEMIKNLKTTGDYILVNYSRKSLGQPGGGHISPVAAYDQESDSFLVMDVNPNKAPWVWVQSNDLIESMRTFDTVENRGYLLISL